MDDSGEWATVLADTAMVCATLEPMAVVPVEDKT